MKGVSGQARLPYSQKHLPLNWYLMPDTSSIELGSIEMPVWIFDKNYQISELV